MNNIVREMLRYYRKHLYKNINKYKRTAIGKIIAGVDCTDFFLSQFITLHMAMTQIHAVLLQPDNSKFQAGGVIVGIDSAVPGEDVTAYPELETKNMYKPNLMG